MRYGNYVLTSCTVWINEKFTLTEEKFRQINYLFSNFSSETVTFTKFLPKMRESEFLEFPQCDIVEKPEIRSHLIFFVKSTIYLVISLVKPLLSRNFCQKCVRVNFRIFHSTLEIPEIHSHAFLAKIS